MRRKQDINLNQCDKCGKIQEEGELYNCDISGDYEGLAICINCYNKLKGGLKE